MYEDYVSVSIDIACRVGVWAAGNAL